MGVGRRYDAEPLRVGDVGAGLGLRLRGRLGRRLRLRLRKRLREYGSVELDRRGRMRVGSGRVGWRDGIGMGG